MTRWNGFDPTSTIDSFKIKSKENYKLNLPPHDNYFEKNSLQAIIRNLKQTNYSFAYEINISQSPVVIPARVKISFIYMLRNIWKYYSIDFSIIGLNPSYRCLKDISSAKPLFIHD